MPQYDYRCTGCGKVKTVTRSFAEHERALARERDPRFTPLCKTCFGTTVRVFAAPGLIVRPSGWHLRPGDPGYADFRREAELGELREDPVHTSYWRPGDESAVAEAKVDLTDDQLYEIHQMGQVMDRAIADADIPEG